MRIESGIARVAAAALVLGLGVGVLIRASGRSSRPDEPPASLTASPPTSNDHEHAMGDPPGRQATPEATEIAIDLENPECPIMGGDTEGEVFTHWRGLRIQFCCAGCEEGFLASPGEALSEAGIDYEEAIDAIERFHQAEGEERERVRAEIAARFTLVELDAEGRDDR